MIKMNEHCSTIRIKKDINEIQEVIFEEQLQENLDLILCRKHPLPEQIRSIFSFFFFYTAPTHRNQYIYSSITTSDYLSIICYLFFNPMRDIRSKFNPLQQLYIYYIEQ
eukprot:371355_1